MKIAEVQMIMMGKDWGHGAWLSISWGHVYKHLDQVQCQKVVYMFPIAVDQIPQIELFIPNNQCSSHI